MSTDAPIELTEDEIKLAQADFGADPDEVLAEVKDTAVESEDDGDDTTEETVSEATEEDASDTEEEEPGGVQDGVQNRPESGQKPLEEGGGFDPVEFGQSLGLDEQTSKTLGTEQAIRLLATERANAALAAASNVEPETQETEAPESDKPGGTTEEKTTDPLADYNLDDLDDETKSIVSPLVEIARAQQKAIEDLEQRLVKSSEPSPDEVRAQVDRFHAMLDEFPEEVFGKSGELTKEFEDKRFAVAETMDKLSAKLAGQDNPLSELQLMRIAVEQQYGDELAGVVSQKRADKLAAQSKKRQKAGSAASKRTATKTIDPSSDDGDDYPELGAIFEKMKAEQV